MHKHIESSYHLNTWHPPGIFTSITWARSPLYSIVEHTLDKVRVRLGLGLGLGLRVQCVWIAWYIIWLLSKKVNSVLTQGSPLPVSRDKRESVGHVGARDDWCAFREKIAFGVFYRLLFRINAAESNIKPCLCIDLDVVLRNALKRQLMESSFLLLFPLLFFFLFSLFFSPLLPPSPFSLPSNWICTLILLVKWQLFLLLGSP